MTMPILSFDDGPSEWTSALLDVLAEFETVATFFVVGQSAALLPAVIRRTVAEGHQVGVHGWTHTRLTGLPDDEVELELRLTAELIMSVTGSRPSRFRAPFFDTNSRVDELAATLGLKHMGASVVPDDWAECDPEAIARTVLAEIRPGSVVCLHDGIPPDGGSSSCTDTRQPTVDAVRQILEALAVRV